MICKECTLICAIGVPQCNIMTFQTMFNVYFHNFKVSFIYLFIVVAIWMNKNYMNFCAKLLTMIICMCTKATFLRMKPNVECANSNPS